MDELEARTAGDELRRDLREKKKLAFDFGNPGESADVLHAICQSLAEECSESPDHILNEATAIRDLLSSCPWTQDDLGEREGLICTLTFICWRAARILGRTRDAQRWESEYKTAFRHSLHWDVTRAKWESEEGREVATRETLASGPESVFQALHYLHQEGEAAPQRTADGANELYRQLESNQHEFAPDFLSFFRGESARVVAGAQRIVGASHEVQKWLDIAEGHFRDGPDPKPHLARVAFARLAFLYLMSSCDAVCQVAPELEGTFADLGMEEDRVKTRILWAMSLKLLGRLEESIKVLEPVHKVRAQIRPGLYGWVLLHSADVQQISGNYEQAVLELTEAASLLREGRQFTGLADVNMILSGIYRSHGMLGEAIELVESSRRAHQLLGMKWLQGYAQMLIAETYLAMGQPLEAEREIREALPVLEEAGIVPDAVAALNILREAVRRRNMDPESISDIRERLRPKN